MKAAIDSLRHSRARLREAGESQPEERQPRVKELIESLDDALVELRDWSGPKSPDQTSRPLMANAAALAEQAWRFGEVLRGEMNISGSGEFKHDLRVLADACTDFFNAVGRRLRGQ